jgi:hypothetical protein
VVAEHGQLHAFLRHDEGGADSLAGAQLWIAPRCRRDAAKYICVQSGLAARMMGLPQISISEVDVMRLSDFSRVCAALLISTLLGNSVAFAASKHMDAASAKAKIEARGQGHGLRIVETDKSQVTGTIVSIGEQSVVLQPKTGTAPVEIPYAQVSEVHNDKLSKGAKIGIGVGIAAAAVAIVAIVFAIQFKRGFPKTIPI